MNRIGLYPFEFFDPLRRRWVRARYRASLEEIAARYPQHRIVCEPEFRDVGEPAAITAGQLARGPH